MNDELLEFESRKVRIHKKIGSKVFFYQGYLKTVNKDSILLLDRKRGLMYLTRNDIVSVEALQ